MDDNNKPSIWDWYDTEADHNWRQKLNALSDTSVPSPISSDEWNRMSDQEKDIYRAVLDQTRTRQNGPYPGNCL